MTSSRPAPSPAVVTGSLLAQFAATMLFLLFTLESAVLARNFLSEAAWLKLLRATGGSARMTPEGIVAEASLMGTSILALLLLLSVPLLCAAWTAIRGQGPFVSRLLPQAVAGGWWGLPTGIWTVGWISSLGASQTALTLFLILTSPLALAVSLAGWLWTGFQFSRFGGTPAVSGENASEKSVRLPTLAVLSGMLIYIVVFTAMNWGLWFNLQIPHGDSAMYEEHLWNLLHGKGFRSYLDQGLFLGEHLQVVHLLLLPAYLLWPSHLLLELAESTALALTAWAVYRIAFRHSGDRWAAAAVAIAALLYFPLHSLDIAIDLKTFRPSAFGIPALLFAIDALEERRWGRMTVWFLVTLSCQEDFAIPIALLGGWLAATNWRGLTQGGSPDMRVSLRVGVVTCLLATAYLAFALKIAIPWFRDGETIHYVRYFDDFGSSPGEIVVNILTRPGLVLGKLFAPGSLAMLLLLLVPLGVPYRSWDRLLVAAPLFLLLALNRLAQDPPGPFHHFHAPLVPLLLWAACAGLSSPTGPASSGIARSRAVWILNCAFATGIFYTPGPLGLKFWDVGRDAYWKRLYLPDERARQFEKVLPLIPVSARVASTDFVHPRFTHHERSYDYSNYPRRVADYEDKVPDDTDYIVIDTRHRYSEIQQPAQMRELQRNPEMWELLPVDTGGYFIVLKRVSAAPTDEASP